MKIPKIFNFFTVPHVTVVNKEKAREEITKLKIIIIQLFFTSEVLGRAICKA